jgi:pimeloyl-ACP methyl ester carboxylesterase
MTPATVAHDAVLAGLCSAVYERDRAAREAVIEGLGCEVRQWVEWGGCEAALIRMDADLPNGAIALVIRGTEVSEGQWRDVLANVGIPSPWAGPGRAHTGYVRQLDRILDRVAYALEWCGSPVTVAGHSMGGALATLLASRLWWRSAVGLRPRTVRDVVTFGAPKSIDRDAAAVIGCPVRRYVIAGDLAPLWPPIPGLTHPAPAIHLPAPEGTQILTRGWRGVWPMRNHDVDTYADALNRASG